MQSCFYIFTWPINTHYGNLDAFENLCNHTIRLVYIYSIVNWWTPVFSQSRQSSWMHWSNDPIRKYLPWFHCLFFFHDGVLRFIRKTKYCEHFMPCIRLFSLCYFGFFAALFSLRKMDACSEMVPITSMVCILFLSEYCFLCGNTDIVIVEILYRKAVVVLHCSCKKPRGRA